MNPFDPTILIAVAAGIGAALLSGFAAREARKRRRARRRVIEKPNSHYTSVLVRETETRHRWHGIALDRIHEINRGEVERLLARADAGGVEALRPNERVFLDHMTEIAGTRPRPEQRRESTGSLPPDLSHSPA